MIEMGGTHSVHRNLNIDLDDHNISFAYLYSKQLIKSLTERVLEVDMSRDREVFVVLEGVEAIYSDHFLIHDAVALGAVEVEPWEGHSLKTEYYYRQTAGKRWLPIKNSKT